jgi:hypothetical protein
MATAAVAQDAKESAPLTYKAAQKWTYILPNETWTPVSGNIPVQHAGGPGFITEVQGAALAVDTNGDGKVDEKAKGVSGDVVLKGKNAQGQPLTYAVRLRNKASVWSFAAGGAMAGKIRNVAITVIDQNNNGTYADYGQDAMIVGTGDGACYLSKVVNLDGKLFHFEIAADGKSMSVSPWEGEAGVLDMREGWKGEGKIHSAVVTNDKNDISFNLADAKSGLHVPVGSYRITGGYISNGKETVRVRGGRMNNLAVKNGEATKMAWGGPVTVEFDYTISGDKLTVPYALKFFGKAGEEYFEFLPDATSPIIKVVDEKGKPVAQGRFPGC